MRAGLSILVFHRVLREPDALFPEVIDATRFDTTLRWLARFFRVISLKDGIDALFGGRLGRRSVAITFDDGYADNAQVAAPLLRAHGMHATFFVASEFLGGGRMWNDTVIESLRNARGEKVDLGAWGLGECNIVTPTARRMNIDRLLMTLKYLPQEERDAKVKHLRETVGGALPDNLMMSLEQLRQLADSGMEIGAHTVSHPILARLDNESARAEIANGRSSLEAITGRKVHLFAYPNGKPGEDYGGEHVAMVRELGFSAAVSTVWGTARTSDDRFQLPRFTPWDRNPIGFSLRLAARRLRHSN
jgi:peptidoglycan/xylan/chitin deacetylase (PgdA/CDA1 family)